MYPDKIIPHDVENNQHNDQRYISKQYKEKDPSQDINSEEEKSQYQPSQQLNIVNKPFHFIKTDARPRFYFY